MRHCGGADMTRMFRAMAIGVFVFAPSAGEAGLSGDTLIDVQLGTGYNMRAGGKLGGVFRSNLTKCNSVGADPQEHNCPNDALYTPAPANGGYQAWGVGVKHIFGEGSEIECALIPILVFSDPIQIYFERVCYLVPVATPMGTFANSMIRIRWGTATLGTSQYSSHPTSVLAFHESLLAHCNPFLLNESTARCGNVSNSTYVEDNGYEAKIVISDSACQASAVFGRTGGPADINNNCFYYHNIAQVNDLPSAYRDTTISDSRSVLIIGFGSADAASIDPGTTYLLKQFFRSNGQPIVQGTNAMHLGAVTSEMLSGAACISGGFANNRCFYGVDTAAVGGPGNQFSQVVPPTP